jgi:hypothetical protein
MQAAVVPCVLQSTRNLVVAAPTGSGKTLVADSALLDAVVNQHQTGAYLVPMRALATEKRDDWRRFETAGLTVYKTSGEDDAFDPAQAQRADIIVATPEKWDSVSRPRLPKRWLARLAQSWPTRSISLTSPDAAQRSKRCSRASAWRFPPRVCQRLDRIPDHTSRTAVARSRGPVAISPTYPIAPQPLVALDLLDHPGVVRQNSRARTRALTGPVLSRLRNRSGTGEEGPRRG